MGRRDPLSSPVL